MGTVERVTLTSAYEVPHPNPQKLETWLLVSPWSLGNKIHIHHSFVSVLLAAIYTKWKMTSFF